MKVAIIGAGSAAFSIAWIRDLCIMKSAPGSTFSLVDVNEERLESAYELAKRYATELGVKINFEKSTDRRNAIVDSDYVINTAFPGDTTTRRRCEPSVKSMDITEE